MNGELRTLYIDSNFATKDSNNRYTYDFVGGVAVPENSHVFVDNISFTNTFSEKVDEKSNELYVKTRSHNNLRDPSDVLFNWTYNGVLNDHLLAGTYEIKQHYFFTDLETTATTWATPAGQAVSHARQTRQDLICFSKTLSMAVVPFITDSIRYRRPRGESISFPFEIYVGQVGRHNPQ